MPIKAFNSLSLGSARPVRASRQEPMGFEQAFTQIVDGPGLQKPTVRLKIKHPTASELGRAASRAGQAVVAGSVPVVGAVGMRQVADSKGSGLGIAGNPSNWAGTATLVGGALLRGSAGPATGAGLLLALQNR